MYFLYKIEPCQGIYPGTALLLLYPLLNIAYDIQNADSENVEAVAVCDGISELYMNSDGRLVWEDADGEAYAVSPNGESLLQPDYNTDAAAEVEAASTTMSLSPEDGWKAEDLMPEKLSSTVLYRDVYPGVDLRYTAFSYNLKEQIISQISRAAIRYRRQLEGFWNLTWAKTVTGRLWKRMIWTVKRFA